VQQFDAKSVLCQFVPAQVPEQLPPFGANIKRQSHADTIIDLSWLMAFVFL
jgi:hypothetical protein